MRYQKTGVEMNEQLRTSNPRSYAVGDVIRQAQFTHAADHHARLVLRNVLFPVPGGGDRGVGEGTRALTGMVGVGYFEERSGSNFLSSQALRARSEQRLRRPARPATRSRLLPSGASLPFRCFTHGHQGECKSPGSGQHKNHTAEREERAFTHLDLPDRSRPPESPRRREWMEPRFLRRYHVIWHLWSHRGRRTATRS